jgi:hypothetical protein
LTRQEDDYVNEDDKMDKTNKSRRQFLKTTAYIAPAILTLKAAPALAQCGSPPINCEPDNNGDAEFIMNSNASYSRYQKLP